MNKILICDYQSALEESYDITFEALKNTLSDEYNAYEIKVCAYEDDDQLIQELQGAAGLITGFLEIGEKILDKADSLKYISVSGVGYGNIDCEAANRHGIKVCHIAEYCTEEVAEHTFALINALNRNLKFYTKDIEVEKNWKYHNISGGRTLSNQTLAIFGYGRIGRRVAQIAAGYNMKVIAVDPYADVLSAKANNVEIVTADEAFKRADIISNHMNLTEDNRHFFAKEAFSKMARKPMFINVGRGASVCEEDLYEALMEGQIRAAGLDVLEAEEPCLDECRLLGLTNVIMTPHSAFYSDDSIKALQKISGENLGYCLKGKQDMAAEIVRECK
ncbi:MAG: C-terminal binding protein [Butyrivibrio sp.]|uniref:NAD(P)-dependent oxidoreductase n=1 Tax=Butyrivibrio sp. TaxID=28121 RepID=UPI0025F46410|nr:NAD(P)-dependent oxidoreductase [Butyrivibrio sp.]MCR5770067.1 C-terminal binding protein [Butyrivibrio sp.]